MVVYPFSKEITNFLLGALGDGIVRRPGRPYCENRVNAVQTRAVSSVSLISSDKDILFIYIDVS